MSREVKEGGDTEASIAGAKNRLTTANVNDTDKKLVQKQLPAMKAACNQKLGARNQQHVPSFRSDLVPNLLVNSTPARLNLDVTDSKYSFWTSSTSCSVDDGRPLSACSTETGSYTAQHGGYRSESAMSGLSSSEHDSGISELRSFIITPVSFLHPVAEFDVQPKPEDEHGMRDQSKGIGDKWETKLSQEDDRRETAKGSVDELEPEDEFIVKASDQSDLSVNSELCRSQDLSGMVDETDKSDVSSLLDKDENAKEIDEKPTADDNLPPKKAISSTSCHLQPPVKDNVMMSSEQPSCISRPGSRCSFVSKHGGADDDDYNPDHEASIKDVFPGGKQENLASHLSSSNQSELSTYSAAPIAVDTSSLTAVDDIEETATTNHLELFQISDLTAESLSSRTDIYNTSEHTSEPIPSVLLQGLSRSQDRRSESGIASDIEVISSSSPLQPSVLRLRRDSSGTSWTAVRNQTDSCLSLPSIYSRKLDDEVKGQELPRESERFVIRLPTQSAGESNYRSLDINKSGSDNSLTKQHEISASNALIDIVQAVDSKLTDSTSHSTSLSTTEDQQEVAHKTDHALVERPLNENEAGRLPNACVDLKRCESDLCSGSCRLPTQVLAAGNNTGSTYRRRKRPPKACAKRLRQDSPHPIAMLASRISMAKPHVNDATTFMEVGMRENSPSRDCLVESVSRFDQVQLENVFDGKANPNERPTTVSEPTTAVTEPTRSKFLAATAFPCYGTEQPDGFDSRFSMPSISTNRFSLHDSGNLLPMALPVKSMSSTLVSDSTALKQLVDKIHTLTTPTTAAPSECYKTAIIDLSCKKNDQTTADACENSSWFSMSSTEPPVQTIPLDYSSRSATDSTISMSTSDRQKLTSEAICPANCRSLIGIGDGTGQSAHHKALSNNDGPTLPVPMRRRPYCSPRRTARISAGRTVTRAARSNSSTPHVYWRPEVELTNSISQSTFGGDRSAVQAGAQQIPFRQVARHWPPPPPTPSPASNLASQVWKRQALAVSFPFDELHQFRCVHSLPPFGYHRQYSCIPNDHQWQMPTPYVKHNQRSQGLFYNGSSCIQSPNLHRSLNTDVGGQHNYRLLQQQQQQLNNDAMVPYFNSPRLMLSTGVFPPPFSPAQAPVADTPRYCPVFPNYFAVRASRCRHVSPQVIPDVTEQPYQQSSSLLGDGAPSQFQNPFQTSNVFDTAMTSMPSAHSDGRLSSYQTPILAASTSSQPCITLLSPQMDKEDGVSISSRPSYRPDNSSF